MQMSRVSHGTGLLITFQFVEFIMESVNGQPPGAETNNFFIRLSSQEMALAWNDPVSSARQCNTTIDAPIRGKVID